MSGKNGNSSLSLRERLLAVPLRRTAIDIPGYPTLYLQEQTAAERWTYEQEFVSLSKNKEELDRKDFVAALVARHIVDENGQRVFDSTEEDVEVMRGAMSWSVIEYLYGKCHELFRWTEDAVKGVEKELEDNPLATPSSNSPTSTESVPQSS